MDGILIIDKPQGMTSHDVCDFVRKKFGVKSVGHAGTLDPMATGVLVILLGKYTKEASKYVSNDKEYLGRMILGGVSDTDDAWGNVVRSNEKIEFTNEHIKSAFDKFIGEIEQAPPAYSARKYKGKKLYEFARQGISVTVEPRKVLIKELDILKIELPSVDFRIKCSKGTYVRALARDIGKALGCGAYLSRLCRTRSGRFTIEEALKIEDLRENH